jgi:hypothetical protein
MRPATSLTSSPMHRSSLSLPPAVHQLPHPRATVLRRLPRPTVQQRRLNGLAGTLVVLPRPSQIGPPHPRRINQSRRGPQGTITVIVECVSSLKQGWIVL